VREFDIFRHHEGGQQRHTEEQLAGIYTGLESLLTQEAQPQTKKHILIPNYGEGALEINVDKAKALVQNPSKPGETDDFYEERNAMSMTIDYFPPDSEVHVREIVSVRETPTGGHEIDFYTYIPDFNPKSGIAGLIAEIEDEDNLNDPQAIVLGHIPEMYPQITPESLGYELLAIHTPLDIPGKDPKAPQGTAAAFLSKPRAELLRNVIKNLGRNE
jgi:hypothetical protein